MSGNLYFLKHFVSSCRERRQGCVFPPEPAERIIVLPPGPSDLAALTVSAFVVFVVCCWDDAKCKQGQSVDGVGVTLYNDSDQLTAYLNLLLCVCLSELGLLDLF